MLGVMLAGIVAMQVEVIKLGASIGRNLQRGTALQSRNEQLRASVARLADDQRVERIAASMGMVMPAPTSVRFVSVGPGTVGQALTSIRTPAPTSFEAALQTSNAAANTPAPPATPATATGVTSTGTGPSSSSVSGSTPAAASSTGATAVSASPTPTSTGASTPAASAGQGSSTASATTGAAPTTATPTAPVTSSSSSSTSAPATSASGGVGVGG
jgi:hypothetical protein